MESDVEDCKVQITWDDKNYQVNRKFTFTKLFKVGAQSFKSRSDIK